MKRAFHSVFGKCHKNAVATAVVSYSGVVINILDIRHFNTSKQN